MEFNSIQEYKDYVDSQLETIDLDEVVSSYDTGYGLSLVDTYLGETCHPLDVRHCTILRIAPPSGLDSMNYSEIEVNDSDWDIAWTYAKEQVRQYHKESQYENQ